jgi:hypothetical protein
LITKTFDQAGSEGRTRKKKKKEIKKNKTKNKQVQ